jgi:cell wall-associated NlpC family hydrolase
MQSAEEPQEASEPAKRALPWPLIISSLTVVLLVLGVVALSQLLPGGRPSTGAAAAGDPPATSAPASATPPASTSPPPTSQAVGQALGRKAAVVPRAEPTAFDKWITKTGGWLNIPSRAMRAYASATLVSNKEKPTCHMSWVTLAAIGKHASDHGRAHGNAITSSGELKRPIRNVEMYDFFGKQVSDPSARGPMQLPSGMWDAYAERGADKQNIDDAATTAARALCDNGRDLADGGTWWHAVARINDTPLFLHRVLATATVYGTVAQNPNPPKTKPLRAVDFAISKIGLPYVWGGNGVGGADHGGFDCSGLTTAAYGEQHVTLPRTADMQFHSTRPVAKNQEPQLGDLIFFGSPSKFIHHVGIYIGNHQMIDAPTQGQAVQVHRYHEPGDDFAGAGRVVS